MPTTRLPNVPAMPTIGGIASERWGALATGNAGVPSSAEWPIVGLALVAIALVGTLTMRAAGLSWLEAGALAGLAPALVLVDLPLGESTSGVRLFANLAGCVLPVLLGIAIVLTRDVPRILVFVLLSAGVVLALAFSWVVPARGVLLDYRACALVTGLVAAALLHGAPRTAGALAFAAAAIGTTVGADLLRLGDLLSLPQAAAVTLGGAGLLDGILLTSVAAALVAAGSAAGVHALSRAVGRSPTPARA